MRELVTQAEMSRILLAVGAGAPIAGAALGALFGRTCKQMRSGMVVGFAAGLSGTAVLGLWHLYLAFNVRYGCASVNGLLILLATSVVLGVAIGVAIRKTCRALRTSQNRKRRARSTQEDEVNVNKGVP